MNYYLTLTYKNDAGEVCTEEIYAFGVKANVIAAGAKFLRSIGLDYKAIVSAKYRCPALAGLGLGL